MRLLSTCAMAGLFACAATTGYSAVEVTAPKAIDIDWTYVSGAEVSEYSILPYGYLRDYSGDGIPDYLLAEDIEANGAIRLWAIDSAATGGSKAYPADRAAGREFTIDLGTFYPDMVQMIHQEGSCDIDIYVQGDNRTTDDGEYTQLIYKRLNLDDPNFPDAATFTIPVQSELWPYTHWSEDFTGDGYPDIVLGNSLTNSSDKFFVACYNGKDGAEVWSIELDPDPNDPGGTVLGLPQMFATILPMSDTNTGTGDLDGDGKPEILLEYTYGYMMGEFSFGTRGMIRVLNGNGTLFTGYSDAWVELIDLPGNLTGPSLNSMVDFNNDGKTDILVSILDLGMDTAPPPFLGFDLLAKQELFRADAAEFNWFEDTLNAMTFHALRSNYRFGDVDGDGFGDLTVHGMQPNTIGNLTFGVFHAYSSNANNRGKAMSFMATAGDATIWWANDFGGSDILDFLIVDHPDAPGASTVDFKLQTTAIWPSNIDIPGQGTFKFPHEFGTVDPDDFDVQTMMGFPMGDLDGDGQKDTFVSIGYKHAGNDVPSPLAYGQALFFDNTAPGTPLEETARLQIKSDSDRTPYPLYETAIIIGHYEVGCPTYVDQNSDGKRNDGVVTTDHVVAAISFKYDGSGFLPEDVLGFLLGQQELSSGQLPQADSNSDGLCDAGDLIQKITAR
ncbi:VCBS repeat-containing protein [bacterium]|nr:VCBS repeat-containing protein [bacterium]